MNKKLLWLGRIFTVLAVIPFLPSFYMKLNPTPQVGQQMAHLGVPGSLMIPLAILEGLCVILYLIPATSVLGAVLFTGYLGGAVLTHLRVGEPVFLPLILGLVVWLGIYLREPRLHRLLPLRRSEP